MNLLDKIAVRLTPNVNNKGHYVRTNLGGRVRRTLGKLRFVLETVTAYYCACDPKTPFRVEALTFATLAYSVSSVDMIPDLIAVFGFTDDGTVF